MIAQVFSAGLAAVIPLVILALIVFAIVALVTGRRDPDPAGSRPYTIYLVLIIFFSMFTALFALTSMASNIAKIPQSHTSQAACPPTFISCPQAIHAAVGGSSYDPAKQQTAAAIEAALVALVALAVLWWHVRRLRELVQDPTFNLSAGRRTYQVYLHAVSFTAAAIFIFAAAAALYAIFRIAAPGYTAQLAPESVERDAGVVQLVSAGFLAIASWWIFRYHWRRTQTLRGTSPLPPSEQGQLRWRHIAPPGAPTPPAPGAPPATRPETPPAGPGTPPPGPETPPASEPA